MTDHPNDVAARQAASMYPDMTTHAPANDSGRTTSSSAGSDARTPAARPTPPATSASPRDLPWERMYPEMKRDEGAVTSAAVNADAKPTQDESKFDTMYGDMHREPEQPDVTVDELVAQPLTDADRMYPDGGCPLESADDYDQQTLSEPFDTLQMQARFDGNEEEAAILAEGRQQAAAVLHGMAVPSEAAREIAGELEFWNARWIKGDLPGLDEMDSTRQKTEASLRKEWGPKYNANVQLARQAYQEAAKQLPWLRNLVEDAGAGNSAALLRHFATIGLNNARNRRGSGGNRK